MWLRQLASQDAEIRHDALNALEGSLCHQGGICPATGYAVPFLIELARDPKTPERDAILALLASIALADPLDEKPWRDNPRLPMLVVPAEIPFKDAQAEVAAGSALYIALLDDTTPEIRMQAAHALVSLPLDTAVPESAEELRELLRARFGDEEDERVRANLVAALGRSNWPQGADDIQWFRGLLAPENGALVRFYAALRLAELQQEAAPRAALNILIEALREQETLRPAALKALYEFGPERLNNLVPWLKEAIAHPEDSWGMSASLYADLLLFIVFYGRPQTPAQPRSASKLTTRQTEILKHLLASMLIWRHGAFTRRLRAYGLPDDPGKLAAYLGEAEPALPGPRSQRAFHDPHGARLDGYRAILRERYPQIAVRVLNGAWRARDEDALNDDIFSLNNDLIFRFPRRPDALATMAREVRLLNLLQGRLPLPIPNPVYSRIDTAEVGQAYMGYALFKGKPLYKEMLESLPGEAAAIAVAESLGAFMQALHTVALDDLDDVDLPLLHTQEQMEARIARIREQYAPRLHDAKRKIATQMLSLYETDPYFRDFTPSLIHGALEPQAILYNARDQEISGVIGFSHAGIGDPAYDLACLLGARGYGAEFAKRFIPIYPALAEMFKRAVFYVWLRFFESRMEPRQERRSGFGVYFPTM